VGESIVLPNSITSDVYVRCLEDGLIKTLKKFNMDPKMEIFQQDNALVHTSRRTREWLEINKINVIEWLPQSPDMNPIENLLDIIDRRIRKRVDKLGSLDELWEEIQREWNSTDKNLILNLYMSMGKRIYDLKNSQGGSTKY
jgi:transposase